MWFLSNPEEETQLLSDDYQNRLAWGIYNGIMDYFIIANAIFYVLWYNIFTVK